MAIIILPICFISIFLSLHILWMSASDKRDVLLGATLVFCGIIVLITEVLSLFHQLNYTSVLTCWLVITLVNTIYHFIIRHKLYVFYKKLLHKAKQLVKRLSLFERLLLIAITAILLLVFIQGIVYPPTNWDSMTYHLARIPSWISHQSVQHFPTAITRQIYQPPFAEYAIMQFNILSRNDAFSAALQFFFMLLALVVITGIVKNFGLNRKYQVAAIVLAITIPEVILQASSTQNDIVVSFFILASFYFAQKAVNTLQFKYYLLLGLAAGLGVFTKGTAYIYLAPIILVFGTVTLSCFIKTRKATYLTYAIVVVLISIAINAGHYYRNYKLAGNILGVDKTEVNVYANQKMTPLLLASGLIKNAGLHMSIMYARPLAVAADSIICKLHAAAGININNPAVSYRGMKYGLGTIVTSEDSAPNPFHFLLILFSVVLLLFNRKRLKASPAVYSLLIIVTLQIIFFCLYLKWQPWNSRLQVPVFLMATPLICYAFSLAAHLKKAAYFIAVLLLAYAFLTVLHNDSRPISATIFNESRYRKYFANKPDAYAGYNKVSETISQNNFKNIGLMLGVDDWEYPLFTACYSREINPVHINVNNITNRAAITGSSVDCIVSTTTNKPFIDYNNRRYYNQDSGNKIIHLYK
jgi:4-amino-4-deoxy-L-arabinose transferase-like glycosyltransferase